MEAPKTEIPYVEQNLFFVTTLSLCKKNIAKLLKKLWQIEITKKGDNKVPPNKLEIMVFAQINTKNDWKLKFNAEITIVFASPSLKKGVNFGRIVSIYENKSESEVKKAIFSVKIWFFVKFFNFFILPINNEAWHNWKSVFYQFDTASNCTLSLYFAEFSICTKTLFGKQTTEFDHPQAIQVLFGQGESIMRTLLSEISNEVMPISPWTVKTPLFCKEYSNRIDKLKGNYLKENLKITNYKNKEGFDK